MRCFVAVDVSDRAREQIGEFQRSLKSGAGGVRWVKPDRMHLTLAFLGEVTDEFADSVKMVLPEAVTGLSTFQSRLHGVGAFPSPGRARVVWVGIDQGKEELVRLQQAVVAGLTQVGFKPERRPFSPHLTLGRLRQPADVSALVEREFTSQGFMVDRVVLYQSILKPEGPDYTRLAEFELATCEP